MPRVIWSSGNCTLYVRGEREELGARVCEKSWLIRVEVVEGREEGEDILEEEEYTRGRKRKKARGIRGERKRSIRSWRARKKEEKYADNEEK